MDVQKIPLISVSYNSVELVRELLTSFRAHYSNPIFIIDGSSAEHFPAIERECASYLNVNLIHFEYNIHHGPGLAWAYQNLDIKGPVLILDSDVIVLREGLVEALAQHLTPDMYGVGYVNHVNEGGYDVNYEVGAVRYLHPACMLCNVEVLRQWPLPTKHGAPNIEPMLAIHRAGRYDLIEGIPWVKEDFSLDFEPKHYLRHDWQGTVKRTGGYHLEEWEKTAQQVASVRQLTISLIPESATSILEIGANDGAMSRLYKSARTSCQYNRLVLENGIGDYRVDADNQIPPLSVEESQLDVLGRFGHNDCWLLDQALERLIEPIQLLKNIRNIIASSACVVAIIPNAQHWSLQAKICSGDFRYDTSVLMESAHLRWFTRATIFELFQNAGFRIVGGFPVIHERLVNPAVTTAIRELAASVGADPELALEDSQAVQYIVKAVPV